MDALIALTRVYLTFLIHINHWNRDRMIDIRIFSYVVGPDPKVENPLFFNPFKKKYRKLICVIDVFREQTKMLKLNCKSRSYRWGAILTFQNQVLHQNLYNKSCWMYIWCVLWAVSVQCQCSVETRSGSDSFTILIQTDCTDDS